MSLPDEKIEILKQELKNELKNEIKELKQEIDDMKESIIELKEYWKTNLNYPKYEVSNFGNVKHKEFDRLFNLREEQQYYYIHISDKNDKPVRILVHRLVAETFIPNPENKKTVNHKDADKHNNKISNLEWATHKEQMEHVKEKKLINYDRGGRKVQVYKHDEKNSSIKNEYKIYNSVKEAKLDIYASQRQIYNMLNNGIICDGYSCEYLDDYTDLDGEIWKTVVIDGKEYENYKVSNFGRLKRNDVIKMIRKRDGYLISSISDKKDRMVHRLVAEAFIPNPNNKKFVDHIDTNRSNNNVNNLRWATYKENNNNEETKRKRAITQSKKVDKYDIDGNYVDTYNSITEAGKSVGRSQQNISHAIKNKTISGNYYWKLAENNE
jgi:hypothetical protein